MEIIAGKKYYFRILAHFARQAENVSFGFILETAKGISVLSCNSFMCKKNLAMAETGAQYEAWFAADIPCLLEGEYLVNCAICTGELGQHVFLDWKHGIGTVKIFNNGFNYSIVGLDATLDIRRIV